MVVYRVLQVRVDSFFYYFGKEINTNMNIALEAFGYVGTVLVIISMLMTSLVKLRIINMCGSVISTIYSIIVGAWPIVVMNTFIFGINMYQVIKSLKKRNDLTCVPARYDDGSVKHFISLCRDGIKAEIPEYDFNIDENSEVHLIYRESTLISIFAGKTEAETFIADMNYTLPAYRSNIDERIFAYFKEGGMKKISTLGGTNSHNEYLKKLGFSECGGSLVREL